MNTHLPIKYPSRATILAVPAAIACALAFPGLSWAGAVGGTGSDKGGGGGGGKAPDLVQKVSDNGMATISIVGILLITAFALVPLVKAVKDRNFGVAFSVIAVAGVAGLFVTDPAGTIKTVSDAAKSFTG